MKISENAQRCSLTPIRKYMPFAVEAKKKGRKIYHLNIGQPDIETPPIFFETAAAFKGPVLEYAPSAGVPALIEAIRSYYSRIGVEYESADIAITNGGSEALQILMKCILDPGSEVIIPEPFYPNYSTFVNSCGGVIRPLPTTAEEGYKYAFKDRLEALINENTRAILFTNPGNPTGVVLSMEEMRIIAEVAKAHDLYVIGDEVYREFVYGGEELLCIGQIEGIEENAVVIDSVSKRFSACGARIGALITKNKALQNSIMKFLQGRLSCAMLEQAAAAKLYTVDDSYFAAVREEYKKRRDTIYSKLSAIPGVVCKKPMGAFYVMAKLPIDDADSFQQWLLTDFEDQGETLMFAPGAGFYATPGMGKNEVRLAYVFKESDLERAMELLALGIEAYNKRR